MLCIEPRGIHECVERCSHALRADAHAARPFGADADMCKHKSNALIGCCNFRDTQAFSAIMFCKLSKVFGGNTCEQPTKCDHLRRGDSLARGAA